MKRTEYREMALSGHRETPLRPRRGSPGRGRGQSQYSIGLEVYDRRYTLKDSSPAQSRQDTSQNLCRGSESAKALLLRMRSIFGQGFQNHAAEPSAPYQVVDHGRRLNKRSDSCNYPDLCKPEAVVAGNGSRGFRELRMTPVK